MAGKVRAHDDPHGQVLSLRKNGLRGDGALDFPHAAGRPRLAGRRGRLGSQFCSLAKVGNGMGLVSGGEDRTVGLEYCSSPVISFRWLLLAVSGHSRMLKLTTKCKHLRLSPQIHPPSLSVRNMYCLSNPPFYPPRAKYLVFGNSLFAFLFPEAGRA